MKERGVLFDGDRKYRINGKYGTDNTSTVSLFWVSGFSVTYLAEICYLCPVLDDIANVLVNCQCLFFAFRVTATAIVQGQVN